MLPKLVVLCINIFGLALGVHWFGWMFLVPAALASISYRN